MLLDLQNSNSKYSENKFSRSISSSVQNWAWPLLHAHLSGGNDYVFAILLLKLLRLFVCSSSHLSFVPVSHRSPSVPICWGKWVSCLFVTLLPLLALFYLELPFILC